MSLKRGASDVMDLFPSSKQARLEENMDSQSTVDYAMDADEEDESHDLDMQYSYAAAVTAASERTAPAIQLPSASTSTPVELQRIVSVDRDAQQIADMLNMNNNPDFLKNVTKELEKNRGSANRMEIVTNNILEKVCPIPSSEAVCPQPSNTCGQSDMSIPQPSSSEAKHVIVIEDDNTDAAQHTDEVINDIFGKMCEAYKDLRHKNLRQPYDLNKLFQLVEENIHRRKCIDIVVNQIANGPVIQNGLNCDKLVKSKPSGVTTAENPICSTSGDTSVSSMESHAQIQTKTYEHKKEVVQEKNEELKSSNEPNSTKPDTPVKLKSVMSDARLLIKDNPDADPNAIYDMLETQKDNPDRVGLVQAQLASRSSKGKKLEIKPTDPLMQDTELLAGMFPNIDRAEIYAYLEAHHNKPNRVSIVTEELLMTNRDSQGNPIEETQSKHVAANPPSPALETVIEAEQLGPLAALERDVDNIKVVFPDADPMYLYEQLQKLGDNEHRVEQLSAHMSERNSYPRLKERLEKVKREQNKKKIMSMKFDMEEFLTLYPDPKKTFYEEKQVNDSYKTHVMTFLKNIFPVLVSGYIEKVVASHKHHLTPSMRELEPISAAYFDEHAIRRRQRGGRSSKHFRRQARAQHAMPEDPDALFYNELMFTMHEKDIEAHLQAKEADKKKRFEEAKASGLLEECGCCFDDEVLPEDMLECPSKHRFCRECVLRGAEAAIGQGKTSLACMTGECDTPFHTSVLRGVLKPSTMALLLRKIQEEEIEAAGIEGLESCPFCSYSCIMNDISSKVFQCHNPQCMKESCRECREPSHIPLRCSEVEKKDEADMRKFIENRMTEAMIRTCYRCKKRFYKTEGCNKMTCSCGASMCYVCRQPIKGYDHYDGRNKYVQE